MDLFTKPIKTLDDLFVHTLQDIYYAENQIVKNLPEMPCSRLRRRSSTMR
jgi:ferritin-like metal-binding protein YciE